MVLIESSLRILLVVERQLMVAMTANFGIGLFEQL